MTKVKDLLAPFGFAQGRLELVPFPKLARNRVFPRPVKACPDTNHEFLRKVLKRRRHPKPGIHRSFASLRMTLLWSDDMPRGR